MTEKFTVVEHTLKVLRRLQLEAAKEHRYWGKRRAEALVSGAPTYELTRLKTIHGEEATALQDAIDGLYRLQQIQKLEP